KAEVIAGSTLVRSAPTLRRVISFDGAGSGVTGFGELLDHPATAPEVARPAPAELSTIGYTSGTTGHPKGAMQSHRAVILNAAMTAQLHAKSSLDTVVPALPGPHFYGNVVFNSAIFYGLKLVMHSRFDAAEMLTSIQ